MDHNSLDLIGQYQALVGEYAWHSLTVDPNLAQVSKAHYRYVLSALEEHGRSSRVRGMRVLEVASYAHTTGYLLQEELGCDVTLLDISAKALQLGRQMAEASGIRTRPHLIAGDFHALPFESASFDLIYISSAIHHTWKYQMVVSELQRVLAPSGLLLILNEPSHRACCFYAFRTNRPARFTKFERVLDELGVIRTFAEPYLGSRPETLFGMIENQTMPLRNLIELFNTETRILKLVLTPESCMGELENLWLNSRDQGPKELSNLMESTLAERREKALEHFDDVAKGMKFGLPSRDQLQPFAQTMAQSLCALPPASDQEGFRIGLSKIFGAPVQAVVEKPGGPGRRQSSVLKPGFEEKDGVVYAFDNRIKKILLHECSLLPDIQLANEIEIAKFFPVEYWQYHSEIREETALVTLLLKGYGAKFSIPPCQEKVLILLRYHCVCPEKGHARVRIEYQGQQLCDEQVWLSESRLWVAILPKPIDGAELTLVREVIGPGGAYESAPGGLGIAFVGAFPAE